MILKWYGNIGASRNRHYENGKSMPFEIPVSWEWCKVEDLFDLNPKNCIDDNTKVGFIPMELVSAGFGYSHTYNEQRWGNVKKGYCHFQNGDIGIAKISPCFENRKSTIFYDLPNGFGAGTTELVILRGHIVCSEFYLNLFQSSWYISEGTKYFKGNVGQQRVKKDIFTTLLIPLPPLEEQKRIVKALQMWFAAADELELSKTDLQDIIKLTKTRVLGLAIHGKLVPQDPNDEPAVELLKRINPDFVPCDTSHYGQSPQSWCVVKLGDIGKWQAGGTPKRSIKEYYGGDIPWLKTGDLNDGFITDIPEYITQAGLNNSSAKLNPRGSVLVAMYGATIGKMGILTFPATTNQACCACIEHPVVETMYLFYFLLSHRDIFISQGGGGAQPNISKEIIINTHIPLPPLAEQMRIVSKVSELLNLLDKITAEL